jgi:hypothetical protein
MRGNNRRAAVFPLVLVALLVCMVSAYAQTGPAARVISLTGQVSVMRDSTPWALNIGSTVQPRQLIVTGDDGFAEFQVADGSTFQVFPKSQVIFRQSSPNLSQLLDVLIGRIKVQIQKQGKQPNPNSVRTPTAVISVRGTVFDVVVEDDTGTTFVSVDEGLVEVENTTAPGKVQPLNPGESVRVFRNVPLAKTMMDRGTVVQGAVRAAAQAMYEILLRTSRGGGSTSPGGVGTIGQGDKPKPQPPPTAPPAPPPPPPPPPAK